jgi:NADH-quinone oxidoreductase subunit D
MTKPLPDTARRIEYEYSPGHFRASDPTLYSPDQLADGELILNMGPQHPSTHGVLRLEIVTDGEIIRDVVPHLGYLHRCFEAHTQQVPFNQGR